jgi:hypothetical protein
MSNGDVLTVEWQFRTCCLSTSGYPHKKGCLEARQRCPAWLDPFPPHNDPAANNAWYRNQVKDLWFIYGRHCVHIVYLWLGTDGWPTKFTVTAEASYQGWDCGLDDLKFLNYNLPHPSASQIYETLRTRDP